MFIAATSAIQSEAENCLKRELSRFREGEDRGIARARFATSRDFCAATGKENLTNKSNTFAPIARYR